MEVELFIPCFIDQLYPQTAKSVEKILVRSGCTVFYNPEQTCCGQPSFNSGYWNETLKMARKWLSDFSGERFIVSPSASCSGFVRNYYGKLFEQDALLHEQSENISKRLFEFSDFMVNILKKSDLGAYFPHTVTFHDSCAGLREYGIWEAPRLLLEKVEGLNLIEMKDTVTCCGFGGTFAAKFHAISAAMTEQKVENALQTGAEYIVSTEASCLLNIQSYITKNKLPVKTIHLADLLVQAGSAL